MFKINSYKFKLSKIMVNLKRSYSTILLVFSALMIIFQSNVVLSDDHVGSTNDPWERTNRAIFDFNNTLDDNLFAPIARGWRKVPEIPRKPISNLANMAKTPVSLANAVLQLNRESIGNLLSRFLINMTFGLGFMFDTASTEEFGNINEVEEDFGQTLAVWGVGEGPYVMLPIFGPSSVRDTIGMGVDAITNPLSFAYRMNNIGLEARLSGPAMRGVVKREMYLDYVEEMKESSLDFYATMRSLYRQKRKKDISGEMEDEKMSLQLLPIDVYEDEDLAVDVKTEIENIISEEKIEKVSSTRPSTTLPSSNYPGFNERPVSFFIN